MNWTGAVYRALRYSRDLNAVRRGKVGRRAARRVYGRAASRLARRIFG